jgi:hypothetical protein
MSSPNPNTALLFNSVIRNLDTLKTTTDIALAIEEYGLGSPLETRSLDVCYGLATVEHRSAANANYPLIIGTGMLRYLSDQTPDKILTASPYEQPLDPTELLGSITVQDAYAFGSVFLRAWTNGSTPVYDIQAELVRGAGAGNPLLMLRDISQDEALDLFFNSSLGETTIPSAPSGITEYKTLEIFKFLIDITYFDSDNSAKNRLSVIPLDNRRVRGALGFAEEALAVNLVPALIRGHSAAEEQYNRANAVVKEMIDQWVQLDSWQPNFLQFWQSSPVAMPSRLRDYLETELGYVV